MEVFLVVVIPLVIALIVCFILKAQLNSVHTSTAAAYATEEGLDLQVREDRFTHSTQTRRKIESSSGNRAHARR